MEIVQNSHSRYISPLLDVSSLCWTPEKFEGQQKGEQGSRILSLDINLKSGLIFPPYHRHQYF